MVPGLRHAMTSFPHSTFFYHLSPHALIMDPQVDLKSSLLERYKLESLMLRDKSVVPPESVIKTFGHLRGDRIDIVLTQDGEGLCQGSFILRQGEWAKFFLDTWFDPLYRSYNFQKAEGHALVGSSHSPLMTIVNLTDRNTWSSGIRPFWPNWPWSLLSYLTPITSMSAVVEETTWFTGRATLWFVWSAANLTAIAIARTSLTVIGMTGSVRHRHRLYFFLLSHIYCRWYNESSLLCCHLPNTRGMNLHTQVGQAHLLLQISLQSCENP